MTDHSQDILARVSHLKGNQSSQDIYDDWSQTYDDHLIEKCGYISPTVAANALADANDQRDIARSDIKVIDF
ncbi:MAG: putative TPR repeat methyltransferase, partial [Gammaproteobacteria bacterium]